MRELRDLFAGRRMAIVVVLAVLAGVAASLVVSRWAAGQGVSSNGELPVIDLPRTTTVEGPSGAAPARPRTESTRRAPDPLPSAPDPPAAAPAPAPTPAPAPAPPPAPAPAPPADDDEGGDDDDDEAEEDDGDDDGDDD